MDLRNARVCLIAHTFYDRDGRVQRYAETLAHTCHQVDVICLRDEGQAGFKVKNGVRIFSIPYRHRSRKRGGYLLEYGFSLILFSIWMLGLYLKHRHQIIHVHNMPDFLIFAGFWPRIFGAKLILDIHDPMPEVYQSKYPNAQKGLGFRLMLLQERLSAGLSHAVIAANHRFKENVSKRGVPREKITVINNVAEEKIFNRARYPRDRNFRNHSFTLIYVGTIARRYGLDVPIRAMPTLLTQIPEIRLKIIGSLRDGAEELPSLTDELEVASYVEFVPPIPIDEVPCHLIQADIGIYTALPDPHMSIATPTKVLEYTAMGIPTVASRLPILEDLYVQGSIQFFEPGNPEDFARTIIDLYMNPDKRAALVQAADAVFPQKVTWQRERDKYLNLLKVFLKDDHVDNDYIIKEVA